MNPLTHISLCTGIGGFDEAAETLGIKNIANCEIDKDCRTYLKNRFPHATQYTNVITDYPKEKANILSFGFPCQDISISGKGEGIFGERSKIFFNCMDVVRHIQPQYIVIENSPALLIRGMGNVLAEISKKGYNAQWATLSGSQLGYPQKRTRLFIIAYPMQQRCQYTIFQPPGTYELSKRWTPGETFVHVSASRANRFRNITTISRGAKFPKNNFWIHAFGNSVMPVMAEHVFRCLLDFHHKIN